MIKEKGIIIFFYTLKNFPENFVQIRDYVVATKKPATKIIPVSYPENIPKMTIRDIQCKKDGPVDNSVDCVFITDGSYAVRAVFSTEASTEKPLSSQLLQLTSN